MNGILIVNKSKGYTSHDLVNKVKRIIDTNEPLLYFESDILKLYKIRFKKHYHRFYIDLKDNITLDILKSEYDNFLANDIRKVKIYFFKSLLIDKSLSIKSFDVEPIIDNFKNMNDFTEQKNLNKIIEKSTVWNYIGKREEITNTYTKQILPNSPLIIISAIIYIILMIPFLHSIKHPTVLLAIAVIIFLIICFNVRKIISKTQKMKNTFLEVINNEEPLMCFEADIIKIDRKKKELPNNKGWYLQPYILFDDDIELEITNDKYELLISSKNPKIKIYFFEKLLKETNLFDIEIN